MKSDDGNRQMNELGAALRRGDPAGDDAVIDPIEVARMRRRVVAAAAAGRARGWLPVPMLRLAAYAGSALAVVAAGWVVLENLPTAPPATVKEAAPGAPLAESPSEVVAETTADERQPAAAPADAGPAPAPRPAVPQQAAVVVASTAVPQPTETVTRPLPGRPRQMQFVTARGTRVIWTLDPAFDLGRLMPSGKGETS